MGRYGERRRCHLKWAIALVYTTTMQPADIANVTRTILTATHTGRTAPVYFIVYKPRRGTLWAYSNHEGDELAERWVYNPTTSSCVYTIHLLFDEEAAHDVIEYDTADQGTVIYGACRCSACSAPQ